MSEREVNESGNYIRDLPLKRPYYSLQCNAMPWLRHNALWEGGHI